MGKRQRRRLREQSRPVIPSRRWSTDQRRTAEDEVTAHLRRLVEQRTRIDREINSEIDRLATWGFSWGTIARALGVSRQAARQRHGRRSTAQGVNSRQSPCAQSEGRVSG
jgi:hypothetical protein